MQYLYTFFIYLGLPVLIVRLLLLSFKQPAYAQSIPARLGIVKKNHTTTPVIWIHAVSVGEVQAASPLIKHLLLHHASSLLLVTTTTPTGKMHLHKLFADKVRHEYLPYDVPFAIQSFLRVFKPQKLIILETEIWPNLYRLTAEYGSDIYLINARLSEKSFKGYSRFKTLIGNTLNHCTAVSAQFEEDAQRFKQLGVNEEKLVVTGNIKNDIDVSEEEQRKGQALRQSWQDRNLVWIAASTHEGEEALILEAHAQLLKQEPNALLVLAPRHPQRSEKIANLIDTMNLSFAYSSALDNEATFPESNQVLLIDELGVLMNYFAAVDLAFIGGSLIPHGGHNLLEPACLGLPILSGPHLHNFQKISELLLENESLILVNNVEDINQHLNDFLLNKGTFLEMGARARQSYLDNRGSMEVIVKLLKLN